MVHGIMFEGKGRNMSASSDPVSCWWNEIVSSTEWKELKSSKSDEAND